MHTNPTEGVANHDINTPHTPTAPPQHIELQPQHQFVQHQQQYQPQQYPQPQQQYNLYAQQQFQQKQVTDPRQVHPAPNQPSSYPLQIIDITQANSQNNQATNVQSPQIVHVVHVPQTQPANDMSKGKNIFIFFTLLVVWIFSIIGAAAAEDNMIEAWYYAYGRGTRWFWFGWSKCSSSAWDAQSLSEGICGEDLSIAGKLFGAHCILAIFYLMPALILTVMRAFRSRMRGPNSKLFKTIIVISCGIHAFFSEISAFAYLGVFAGSIEDQYEFWEWYPQFGLISQWVSGGLSIIVIIVCCCFMRR